MVHKSNIRMLQYLQFIFYTILPAEPSPDRYIRIFSIRPRRAAVCVADAAAAAATVASRSEVKR